MKMHEELSQENINKLDMIGLGILAEKFAVFVDHVAAEFDRRRTELLREKNAGVLRAALLGEQLPPEVPDRYKPRLFHYGG